MLTHQVCFRSIMQAFPRRLLRITTAANKFIAGNEYAHQLIATIDLVGISLDKAIFHRIPQSFGLGLSKSSSPQGTVPRIRAVVKLSA